MLDETFSNVLVSWLPRPCIAAIAATAMSAAINPYSIAVAPLRLRKSLRIIEASLPRRRVRYCPPRRGKPARCCIHGTTKGKDNATLTIHSVAENQDDTKKRAAELAFRRPLFE